MTAAAYRHLFLAVDFAPETEPVVARAQQLKEHCQARLTLLHVVEYLPMAYSGDLVLPDDFDLEQELLEVAKKQMAVLGERLGVPPEDRHIELGSTGHTILRLADELEADLIIIGSHGRHGLAALLGSTARSVLNGANCDVLAVRMKE
ncbi:MAG: universal stress protein [Pseudomonadota bacterium]|nr:universal stress protein [Pseudomonadota bacterium]